MLYAQIKNGKVANIIKLDDSNLVNTFTTNFDYCIRIDNLNIIPNINWLYDGNVFSNSYLVPTKTETLVSKNVLFNNLTNGFSATESQTAIEEAKNKALGGSRFTLICTFNGTVGNNNWLGYNELLPGNQIPIRLPLKCRIREISFSYNQNTLLGVPLSSENIDGQFQIYKNGLTDPTNVIYTETFINQPGGKNVIGLSLDIAAGDFIVGKWIDTGDNPSDMAIVYFFEIRE